MNEELLVKILDQAYLQQRRGGSPPQPAGKIATDWYKANIPSCTDMLYIIANLLDVISKKEEVQ